MSTPVTSLSDSELNREADQVARRIVAGKPDLLDSMIVIELSNRLIRASQHKCPTALDHFIAHVETTGELP